MKVKNIKEKVAAKVAKGKEKVAAKCGKKKACAAWLVATASLAFIVGCQNPAQRSITIETNVYAYDKSNITFGGSGDVGSAAQSNETGGNDAGMVASPVNDIKPDIDVSVPVNKANAGTSGAAMGALENVLGAGADWVSGKIKGGDNKAAAATQTATQNAATCPGGNCATGACTDGSCSTCTDCQL